MYKVNLMSPHPAYGHTGRVYLLPQTKKFYEAVARCIKKAPDFLAEWNPGQYVYVDIHLTFTSSTNHIDPDATLEALMNGITKRLKVWNHLWDDRFLLPRINDINFGRKSSITFSFESKGG